MKALQIKTPDFIEKSPLFLVDLPKPAPQQKQLLIKVTACGVCRTDLHVIEGDIQKGKYPIIPGHQVVGVVEALGEDCRNYKKGERVGVAWLGTTCNQCSFCKENKENLCPNSEYTGYQLPGGYAEYLVANEDYVYRLETSLSDEEVTPLLCAGIIGYRALKRSQIKEGQKLGIYGFGSSAHLMLQIALHWKCKVFVATRDQKHQKLAKKMGAHHVCGGFDLLPEKVDSIIIFAPCGELVPVALKSLKPGGTCSLAGIHMSDIPQMNYEECLFHEKNLVSVEANTREDGRELLKLAEEIPIKPKIEVFAFDQANIALQKLKKDAIEGTAVLQIKH